MSTAERLVLEKRPGSSQDDELTHVLADYLAEVEAGRRVDPEEWIEKHPAIAERLRTCLKGLQMVEDFAGSIAAAGIKQDCAADLPTLGDFRIVRSLARGGMGIVYEAVQASLDRRVALKVLPFGAAIDPRRLARFRVESQAAAQLHHPHIIPVYSVGCECGVHYYAMQLIDGTTLAEVITELRRSKNSTPAAVHSTSTLETSSTLSASSTDVVAYCREAARLGLQAALALDHAHENGVLHRDVKPSNLMVDGSGHLWVGDFGLARFQTDSRLTVSGDVMGTLVYMSPEQALANRSVVDQRTDVYSLGATLYELITLHAPFEGSNRQELLRKIAQDEPRGPRAVRPGIPLDLETIILKAMAKDLASRYSTAGEMALDLNRFLDDQPIRARRPKVLERLNRLARKHTAIVMAVVPLLVVIVAGLSLGITLLIAKQSQIRKKGFEAERSRADARRQRDVARRAVNEMYTLVAQDWLSKQTKLQPLQRDFLEKALLYFQEFAGEKDADPSIRIEAAWAFYRMGEIERRLGNTEAGERGYRGAIESLEALGKGNPPGPDVLEPLAGCYAGLGELLDETGRAEESTKVQAHSIELRRMLIDCIPETAANFSILATRYEELGTSLGRNGRNKEAEVAFKKAAALGNATSAPNTLTQARSISNLATTLQKQGNLREAERLYREAVLQYERLAREEPRVPLYREQLANSLLNLGQALSRDSKEIEPIFRRAAGAYEGLVTEAPDVPQHRSHLATALLNLANLCFGAGRLREAEVAARQAQVLFEALVEESPKVVRNQEGLARSLAWLGNIRGKAGQTVTALADAQLGRDLYDKLNPKALDLRSNRAWNFGNLAHLQGLSGDFLEADKSWRQAVAHFDSLATEYPGRLDFRSELAYDVMSLALSSTRIGQSADAERHYRRAVDILERVMAEAPERSQDRYRLALAQHHFGDFLFQNMRPEESERFNRLAFKSYERLFFENYQQDLMIRNCAACMKNIATIQIGMKLPDAAVNSYAEALKLFNSLPGKVARDPDVRQARADILDNAGAIYLKYGRYKDAEPRIRQGLEIRESLAALKPDEPKYQESFGMSKIHLGKVLAERGESALARQLFEQGVLLETRAWKAEPRNQDARLHLRGGRKALANFLLDEGAYAECAIISEALLRDHLPSDGIETLMEVAANLTECAALAMSDAKLPPGDRESTARAYARKALELFQKTAESKTDNATIVNLAWFRLTCPVAEFRDFGEAERLARELTSRSPERFDSWSILGASRYHNGDYPGSLSAFQKAREVDQAKFGFWDFYVAMAQWQLGEKPEAQASFERAAGWMKSNPGKKVAQGIRAQAASVLNLADRGATSGKRQDSPDGAR